MTLKQFISRFFLLVTTDAIHMERRIMAKIDDLATAVTTNTQLTTQLVNALPTLLAVADDNPKLQPIIDSVNATNSQLTAAIATIPAPTS